jgi:prevent-host-death family protein
LITFAGAGPRDGIIGGDASAVTVASLCYRGAMSDTPQGGRDPLLVSEGQRSPDGGDTGPAASRRREPGRPASRAEATERRSGRHRIGIRELRQHASVYVDLAEKGYTVDITNRGRLVAQLVPVREPGSPLERLIAAGIVEPAEEPGGVGDIEPYPAPFGGRPAPASRRRGAGEAPGKGGTEERW